MAVPMATQVGIGRQNFVNDVRKTVQDGVMRSVTSV
jgi:hypothetical protein